MPRHDRTRDGAGGRLPPLSVARRATRPAPRGLSRARMPRPRPPGPPDPGGPKREREPDDNEAGVKLRNNSGDRPVVRIDVSAAHNDRMRAREHPSRVARRNADAAFPEVDANYPSPGNPETGCLLLAVTGVQSDPWPLEPGSLGSRPNASSSLAMASSIPARFFPPAIASSGVPPPPPPTAVAAA